MKHARIGGLLCSLGLAGSLASQPCFADEAPAHRKARAEALFDAARDDLQGGRSAAACPKFEESQRLDPGVGTLLHLGECYERVGRTASAWVTFREARALAQSRRDAERAQVAATRADLLEPLLARLVVDAGASFPSAGRVELDNVEIASAAFGTPLPVDPGSHRLVASAPGRASVVTELTVAAKETTRFVLPILSVTPPPTPSPILGPTEASSPKPPRSVPVRSLEVSVIVGGITSGVLLAGGGFFGLRAASAWSESRSQCDGRNVCEPGGLRDIERAQSSAILSTVGVSLGLVVGVVTTVLYLRSPKTAATASGGQISWLVGRF